VTEKLRISSQALPNTYTHHIIPSANPSLHVQSPGSVSSFFPWTYDSFLIPHSSDLIPDIPSLSLYPYVHYVHYPIPFRPLGMVLQFFTPYLRLSPPTSHLSNLQLRPIQKPLQPPAPSLQPPATSATSETPATPATSSP
jgi:hypothetical protein